MNVKNKLLLLYLSIWSIAGFSQSVIEDATWNTTPPILFADEFSSLDTTTKWLNQYPWGRTNNGLEYNLPSNVYILNDALRVRATNVPAGGKSYTGGVISSRNMYQYGYFEARIKLPKGKGYFPAFWLWNASCEWVFNNEIDIMEMYGGYSAATTTIHSSYYWASGVTSPPCSLISQHLTHEYNSGIDLSTAMNKYAVEWAPHYCIYYLNDTPYHIYYSPENIPRNPVIILANLAISSEVDGTTPFPAYMDIDWIRAYSIKKDYLSDKAICTFVKASYDFKVYKTITTGGPLCTTAFNTSDKVTLRARDGITLGNNTTINGNGSGHFTALVTGQE